MSRSMSQTYTGRKLLRGGRGTYSYVGFKIALVNRLSVVRWIVTLIMTLTRGNVWDIPLPNRLYYRSGCCASAECGYVIMLCCG